MISRRPARLLRSGRALVAAAALGAALLTACGESDEDSIRDAALGYGESNGAEACEFLSSSALDQLGGESGCERQFESVPPAEFEVEDVSVDGDSATASVRNVDSDMVIDLQFAKEDDEWLVSSFPGLDQVAPAPTEEEPPPEGGGSGADEGAPQDGGQTTDPAEPEEAEPEAGAESDEEALDAEELEGELEGGGQ